MLIRLKKNHLTLASLMAISSLMPSFAQDTQILRASELRIDKMPTAAVVAPLAAGAAVRVISLEGGWALVEAGAQQGWLRASALNLQAGSSTASSLESGRQATGQTVNTALTLGVRSLPPRSNRHALIIGVGQYADPQVPPLPGTKVDKESATQMATAMQVPTSNITYLQDSQATGDAIRKALADLNNRVAEGDRVFVHYSGHGTRYPDSNGGCIEALLAHDGGQRGTITNREMSELLSPITAKTDKLFVMYDACHSGGVIPANSPLRTRGLLNANDEGTLRPKFSNISEECGRPINVKTRNLVVEQVENKTALPQDVIHISASLHNEISFDDGNKGGLATQFVRDCMLREAKDLDGSGAISMDEIRQCAQVKINERMRNDAQFKPHTLQLSGNTGFIPAWFSQALPGAQTTVASLAPLPSPTPPPAPAPVASTPTRPPVVASAPAPAPVAVAPLTSAPARPPAAAPAPSPAPVIAAAPVAAPIAPLTGEQALRQMFEQRDAKRSISAQVSKPRLKIGEDALEFNVSSNRSGYVYVAMAGSDNKSLYMLFPNDLDQNNRIEAGKPLALPRPNWRVRAGGPAGTNHLLVLVTDGPRDLAKLAANPANKAGPFVNSLNNAQGRAELGSLMSTSRQVTSQECTSAAARRKNPVCSDAYGAVMLSVEEVK
ncbi:MAG: DUF4384 domain-containing protein [Brachymonas sp.]|nr:DUF4384 domain-containing protein [Brachymonas sp.]